MKWILGAYFVMSVVTFVMYGVDKRRAVRGGWRISEGRLHLMELLGGWPGGLLGRTVFHHKGRKVWYRVVFGGIVLVHVGAWGWWMMR